MPTKTEYTCNFKTSARKLNRIKINDLLSKANEANEDKISAHIPNFRTDLKAPDISPCSEENTEDDYIPVLKCNLESLVMEDSELDEYYNGLKTRLNQKKIDEIYTIITANIASEPLRRANERATKSYTIKGNKHLSKKEPSRKPPVFIQETLTESRNSPSENETVDLTTYEEKDFDELSEKIQNGEIGINSDETDSSQITLDMLSKESEHKTDEDDINLKIAFDMISGEDDSDTSEESSEGVFSKLFKYRTNNENDSDLEIDSEESDAYDGFEYNSFEDKKEAELLLKKSVSKSFKKLICTCVLFTLMLGLELASNGDSAFARYVSYGKYSFLLICSELQVLFFIIAIMFGSFISGLKGLFLGKISTESVFFITSVVTVIHSVFSIFSAENNLMLFNIIPAFMALCSTLVTYLKCKKDTYCFRIISSDKEKYVAAELSPSSKEASNFYSYLLEDSDVYTVSKTKNISSFFKRISQKPKSEDILCAIIPCIFFIATIIYVICFFYDKLSVYDSLTATIAFICTAIPATSFFMITLPLISANLACKKIDAAIIGERATEEYATASVISFEDKELFPSDRIKMTNIKTYYNMRIDQVIIELSKIFNHLGGPLKEIFLNAVDGVCEEHTVIKVIESAENGIMVAADGVDYYLGNGEFMREHSFEYDDDTEDEAYERTGGSVMIFGANNVIAAKVYFRYKPKKGFRKLLAHMYDCGFCIGIKTLDPNINNSLLTFHADDSPCPISILKAVDPKEITATEDNVDTGVVSTRSLGSFLKAFMICDKARHAVKSNGLIMLAGVGLTAIMMLFLSFTGAIVNFTPMHSFTFQLIWTTIVSIVSLVKKQ